MFWMLNQLISQSHYRDLTAAEKQAQIYSDMARLHYERMRNAAPRHPGLGLANAYRPKPDVIGGPKRVPDVKETEQ